MADVLKIGDKCIENRFFLGTGKFSRNSLIKEVVEAAGIEVVTVALRRVDIESPDENILDYVPKKCILMVNTSGARNSEEAIRTAHLAEEAGCGKWIKIEVIPDNKYLLPDNMETIKAIKVLAKEGFTVLPYMNPDLVAAKMMRDAGASCVMPLGSPIGSNRGFKTEEIVRIMVREMDIPVIVDAGLGAPSDVAKCMEIGCGAVLVNTAIAMAENPVALSKSFSMAVSAGRLAYLAGMEKAGIDITARSSSPLTGFLG